MYISLFLLIVLTPRIVREGFWVVENQEAAEMFLLFVAGLAGLILYNWRDVESRRRLEEKREFSHRASDAQRDLSSSYAYIGALNRKLDILKEIILSVPQEMYSERKKGESAYAPIIEAMRLFGDCRDVLIGFYRVESSRRILLEIPSREGFIPDVHRERCFFNKGLSMVRENGCAIIRIGKRIKGVSAYCILKRNHIKPQDIELIKALLVQALFLYVALDAVKYDSKR